MRKNAASWIIKILFAIIIVVFVFFYGFSELRQEDKSSVIAKVGDRKISMNEYLTAYKNMLQFYRSLYKDQLSDEMIEKLGLKQKVLEELVDREMLLQEAARLKIQVTPETVRKAVMATPAFQENGVFSERIYQRALTYYGIAAADFERDKQKELVLKMMQDMITRAVTVSDQEVRDMYALQNEKATIDYVVFTPETVQEKMAVADTELNDYYDKHREEFKEPEKLKVQYLVLDPRDFEAKVTVTAPEIEEYYAAEAERFAEPRKVKARHILFKVDKTAAPEQEKEIRGRAEQVLQQATGGEDFAKLAKKFSEDTASAAKGGELGYFKKGDMVKPFEDAAFALKAGETSSLVRSPFGFHIIRVDDITEARTRSLDEVRDTIAAEIRKDKAQDLVQQEAKRAYNRLFKSKNIEEYAKENGVRLLTTDYFTFGASPEDSPGQETFSKEAFALAAGELSAAVALGQKYVILKLLDRKETRIPPLEELKDVVHKQVEQQKKVERARETAGEALAALREGKTTWDDLIKARGLERKTAELNRLGEYISGLGTVPGLKEAVFALDAAQPYAPATYPSDKGVLVVKLKERKKPDAAAPAKETETVRQTLLQNKQRELFEQFVQGLKAKAETWIDTKKFSSL
jgi:peptidyl-prolyl cis-trans isomerase D